MRQLNISLIGDPNSGKKTFMNQIMHKEEQEAESLQFPTYQTVDIEGQKNLNFNFFMTPSNLKGLSKTVAKIMISDIIVIFFNLVEEENKFFNLNTEEGKQKVTQLNMYSSILEPVLETIYFLKKQRNLIIVMNKIDHPQVDYSQEIYNKAEKFLYFQLEKYSLDPKSVPIVKISSLQNQNIVGTLEDEAACFFEEIITLSKQILHQPLPKSFSRLPLRISVLKKHKILGCGIVVQGIVLSGEIKENDEIQILPTYTKTRVKSLEIFNVKAEEGHYGQIVGISLANLYQKDIKKGYVITHQGQSSYDTWEYNGALIKAKFIKTFNGVYPGFFLTLIGFNTKISCYIKEIVTKIDFTPQDNEKKKSQEDEKIADTGSTCLMEVVFLKQFYIERFEDFPQLGQFVIMESNCIFGFAEIQELKNILNQ